MRMLVSALALGVVAFFARGGHLDKLTALTIRGWPLIAAAVAVRVAALWLGSSNLFAISLLFVVLVSLANLGLPGCALIAIGTTLNLAAVVLNSGMPVSDSALETVGKSVVNLDGVHRIITDNTTLPWLGDIVPFGAFGGVYSIGDLIAAFGGFVLPLAQARR